MKHTELEIMNRVELLKTRGPHNEKIINKLERKLRHMREGK